MKKLLFLISLLPFLAFGQANQSMDSGTLATYMVNSDSMPQVKNFTHDINVQVINAILSLNKITRSNVSSQWITNGSNVYYNAGAVGIGNTGPAASAKLEVSSTTQGLLAPRMNTTQQNAISSPATGLLIFNTDSAAFRYYNGSGWQTISSSVGGTGTVTSVGLVAGTSGSDVNISGSPISTNGNITLNVPTASASVRGALSSGDWSTFNGKANTPVAPAVRAVGTVASGTGNVTPGLPTGHTANDILILFVESANEAITAPAGYTQVGPQNGFGTAAASGSTRLAMFWKRDGGSESAPTVTDAGNRTMGVIVAISGCTTSGTPFYFQWNGYKKTASTTWTHLGSSTTIDNMLIVYGIAQSISAATATELSSVANTSLSSVTTQYDNSTNDGVGGGLGVVTGLLATAGSYGSLTATEGSSTVDVSIALAMIPSTGISATNPPTEVYNYVSGGSQDQFVVPARAKSIKIIAIAGGGAGGSGIASTAAGGGGGGGGGKWVKDFTPIELTSPLQINTGSGGVGGSTKSAATSSTVKNNNGSGNTLVNAVRGIIGSDATSNSGGGGGAGGGTNGAATAFGYSGTNGGSGATTGAQPNACEDGGGGGGGGKNASNTTGIGGTSNGGGGGGGGGGSTTQGANGGLGGGGQAGGTGAAAGGNATETGILTTGGSGGGGGGTSAGGNGAQPGGGGGGGGGAANNGGNGGPGAIIIIVYY